MWVDGRADGTMRCHFGSSTPFCFDPSAGGGTCMGAQPEVVQADAPEGEALLAVLLSVALAAGFLLGWCLAGYCQRPEPNTEASGPGEGGATPQGGWARLACKALRFLRKRRRIALAWSNYRNHKLRPLPSTQAEDPFPRQGSGTPEVVRPLQEGPAIRNGAHRRRA